MLLYPVEIKNGNEMRLTIEKIGADMRSFAYFEPKREILKIYIHDADFRAAAFIKQELLSRGGDAIVHRNVIDGRTNKSDVLIMGGRGILSALILKMHSMDCWGLRELRDSLRLFLENFGKNDHSCFIDGLNHEKRTLIMGILNLTPDSFYPDSRAGEDFLFRTQKMIEDGADIIDIGAESTRPGSSPVGLEEEKRRLIEPLKAIRKSFPSAILSIDTMKPEIAEMAADIGVNILNDVGSDPRMGEAAAKTDLPLVVTHSEKIQSGADVVACVIKELDEKIRILRDRVGVKKIIIDPGIGFGKFGEDNFKLISSIESLRVFGLPILVGHSRKKFLSLDGESCGNRLTGTIAVSSVLAGRVNILRVHDIRENIQAVRIADGLR